MELFRFRIVRPVLKQPSTGLDITTIPMTRSVGQPAPVATPSGSATGRSPAETAPDIQLWLSDFSNRLASLGDLVAPDKCTGLLPSDWLTQVGSSAWTTAGSILVNAVTSAMQQRPPTPTVVEAACRQLLVYDLVAILASDQSSSDDQRQLRTAKDVQAAVTWRPVILPLSYFPARSHIPLLARRPGFTDLYVVHDEWSHYTAGEIAAIVNVLPGETFEGQIRHSQTVDTLTATTTEVTTSQLTEQQQTTSSALSESSSKDAALNIGVQGQVRHRGSTVRLMSTQASALNYRCRSLSPNRTQQRQATRRCSARSNR